MRKFLIATHGTVATGPVTKELPASVVQLHLNCEIFLDAAAASLIIGRIRK